MAARRFRRGLPRLIGSCHTRSIGIHPRRALLLVLLQLAVTASTLASLPGHRAGVAVGSAAADLTVEREAQQMNTAADRPRRAWNAIHNWVYWLDGPRPDKIGQTAYELAVIDYSADGGGDAEFSPEQIEALRHAGCERRVLAYLSIGEAEEYRFYWQSAWKRERPAWLVGPNPDWPGNYPVRYWDPAWQGIVYRYLDRIIAQGFDGVYLDRVDAYAEPYAAGREQEMVDFVLGIAAYARARSPLGEDFGIVVQNAEELWAAHPEYLAAITGIGREEVYVRATNEPTTAAERADVEAALDQYRLRTRGSLVLTVDYADRPELIDAVYERSLARGYVPYVADVELKRPRTNPGHEPTCTPVEESRLPV